MLYLFILTGWSENFKEKNRKDHESRRIRKSKIAVIAPLMTSYSKVKDLKDDQKEELRQAFNLSKDDENIGNYLFEDGFEDLASVFIDKLTENLELFFKVIGEPKNEKGMHPYFVTILAHVGTICNQMLENKRGNPAMKIEIEEPMNVEAMGLKGHFEFVFAMSKKVGERVVKSKKRLMIVELKFLADLSDGLLQCLLGTEAAIANCCSHGDLKPNHLCPYCCRSSFGVVSNGNKWIFIHNRPDQTFLDESITDVGSIKGLIEDKAMLRKLVLKLVGTLCEAVDSNRMVKHLKEKII